MQVKDTNSATATQQYTINVYNPLALPAPNPSSLPSTGTTGVFYTGTINASGGSGNYSWSVTGMPSDSLSATPSGGTLTVSGTPGLVATVTFSVKLTDTTTGLFVTQSGYSIAVNEPTPMTLPAPNPTSLPSATELQSYTGAINAAGGTGPFTWTINGVTITNQGTVSLSNGLNATNTGGSTLSIGGTPGTTASVPLTNVKVTDNLNSTASQTYTIVVNLPGSQLSGQVFLNTGCGGNSNVPVTTISIYTSPGGSLVQTTTTDNSNENGTGNGNYSFASVPAGNYTITPSIAGPTSLFFPASQSVNLSGSNVSGENFTAALGYTVSGTVSYGGTSTGQVYLALNGGNCGGNGQPGTSITDATLKSTGAYTIRGVPPGNYTLQAWMDTKGFGAANAANPVPLSNPSVTVVNSSPTGQNVALADPAAVSLSGTAPTLKAVSPANQAAVIVFNAIENSSKVEMPASYTVQWSTSSGFGTVAGSKSFPATGSKGGPSILNGLTNGQVYYFRVQGVAGSSTSSFSSVFGPVTIGALTGVNTVTGTVTFSETATGPLYVGFFDNNSNNAYGTAVGSQASPPTSPATYTVQVPNGSSYFFFGFLDQNNDGMIDAGDVTNTGGGNDKSGLSITGNMSGEDLTLPTANSTATVTTQYSQNTYSGGSSTGYNLSFDVRAGIKLPVAVTLTSGPNVIDPVDLGACTDCGNPEFQYYVPINSDVPSVGDAYNFLVTYSDASTDTETVTATVTGWNGTSTIVGASDAVAASSMLPNGSTGPSAGTRTEPTFTWTYPASPSSYTYSFYICCATNSDIWDIPGNNSNSNGFTSAQIPDSPGIEWTSTYLGDTSNTPSVTSLTSFDQYNWQIQVQDSNGNSAQTNVYYIP